MMTMQGKHKIGFKTPRRITKISALLAFLIASLFIHTLAANADITNVATVSGDYAGVTTTSSPATAAVPVAPQKPAIGLVKKADPVIDFNSNGVTDAGDKIKYVFTVSNMGNVTLSPISVADPSVANIVCVATSIAPGEATTCSGNDYVITQADMDAGHVNNAAVASGTPPTGPVVTDNSDPVTPGTGAQGPTITPLVAKPALTLVKNQSLVGTVSVGSVINYTFTVTNVGTVTENAITLSDSGATITSAGPIASLAPGASDSITFKANHVLTAADIAAGVYQNTATVTGTPAPPGLPATTATDSVSTPLNLNSSMTFTKSGVLANGTAVPPVAGDIVNYSFVVTNTGTSALHNVSVSDPPINLGSLVGNERTVALLAGASEPVDQFATADISTFGSTVHHFGAIESAKRFVAAPDVQTELNVSRQLVRMSGTTPELEVGDKIGFVYTLTNAGDAAFDNIVISQPDSRAYGESLSLLLPNATDSASVIYTRDVTADEIASGQVMSNAYVLAHARGRALVTEVSGGLPISGLTSYETFATASITPTALPLLNPNQSFTFTAPYHLTQADIDAGVVHNTATATALNPADQTLTQVAKADVTLARSSSVGMVKLGFLQLTGPAAAVGDLIKYEFDVTNTGNVTLTNLTVADPLLAVSGGPIASLAPGVTDKVTFTATHSLVLADINAGHYDNQASVTATPPTGVSFTVKSDFADPTQHRPTVVPLTPNPKIALLKQVANVTSGSGPAHVGDIITYQFTIKNVGNVTLSKVVVTDPLMTAAPNLVIGTQFNNFLPGQTDTSFTGKYTVTQADVDKGEVTNTATVTSQAPDGSQVQDSSDPGVFTGDNPTIQPLAQAPKISLVKKYITFDDNNSNGILDVGDKLHYTFAIQNMGNVTLTNIKLNDLLAGAVVSGGPSIATLIPGAIDNNTFTATYVVAPADIPAGQVSNQAQVTADAPGAVVVSANSDNANPAAVNPAPTITPIVVKPAISVIKLPPTWKDQPVLPMYPTGNGLTDAGDTLTYKFKVKNTGNVTLTNVTITDNDPAVTISGAPIPTLTAGSEDTTTFTATYTLNSVDVNAGVYNNQATAFGFSPSNVKVSDLSDPADYTKDAVTPFSLGTTPGIAVIKAFSKFVDGVGATVLTPAAGDSIVYSISVTNTGNVALKNITLSDVNGTITGGTLANLPVNTTDTTSFAAMHLITSADLLAGGVFNQVKAQGLTVNTNAPVSDLSDPADPKLDNQTYVKLLNVPGLAVVKKATVQDVNGNGLNDAGDKINYTFTVINTGNVALFDVKLADVNATLVGTSIASLAVGASDTTTFTASHVITPVEAISGSYSNQATATAALVTAGPVAVNAVSDANGITATPLPTIVKLTPTAPAFTKTADRSEIKRGEQVLYTITGNSLIGGPFNVTDIMPPGFGYVQGSATVNGVAAAPTVNGSSVVFNPVNPVSGKIIVTLKLLASTTLSGGKFVNNARLIDPATATVLAVAQASVEIVAEPVFDCSDIIGRVFDDKNGNGYMDDGEPGLPGVRLVTLNGVLITTDAEGRYHVPCAAIPDAAIGSNYLLKLDPRTLPTGYKLTTENPADVRVTRGKVTVLNFGANFVHDVKVDVTGHAFDGDGVALTARWQTGIAKLCHILDQNQSQLLLVYHQGGESGELAQARIDNLAGQVHDQCDGSKPVKIKKRIEEGK